MENLQWNKHILECQRSILLSRSFVHRLYVCQLFQSVGVIKPVCSLSFCHVFLNSESHVPSFTISHFFMPGKSGARKIMLGPLMLGRFSVTPSSSGVVLCGVVCNNRIYPGASWGIGLRFRQSGRYSYFLLPTRCTGWSLQCVTGSSERGLFCKRPSRIAQCLET